jgi:hypothetical protein
VEWNGHTQLRMIGVFEDVVGAGSVVNTKSGSLKGTNDCFRSDRWQALAHQPYGTATAISSFTGSALSLISSGAGKPSLAKLSR